MCLPPTTRTPNGQVEAHRWPIWAGVILCFPSCPIGEGDKGPLHLFRILIWFCFARYVIALTVGAGRDQYKLDIFIAYPTWRTRYAG